MRPLVRLGSGECGPLAELQVEQEHLLRTRKHRQRIEQFRAEYDKNIALLAEKQKLIQQMQKELDELRPLKDMPARLEERSRLADQLSHALALSRQEHDFYVAIASQRTQELQRDFEQRVRMHSEENRELSQRASRLLVLMEESNQRMSEFEKERRKEVQEVSKRGEELKTELLAKSAETTAYRGQNERLRDQALSLKAMLSQKDEICILLQRECHQIRQLHSESEQKVRQLLSKAEQLEAALLADRSRALDRVALEQQSRQLNNRLAQSKLVWEKERQQLKMQLLLQQRQRDQFQARFQAQLGQALRATNQLREAREWLATKNASLECENELLRKQLQSLVCRVRERAREKDRAEQLRQCLSEQRRGQAQKIEQLYESFMRRAQGL